MIRANQQKIPIPNNMPTFYHLLELAGTPGDSQPLFVNVWMNLGTLQRIRPEFHRCRD